MAYIGKSPSVKRIRHNPQSTAPSNPTEGDVYYDDGSTNTEGLYVYKNAAWELLAAASNLSVTTQSTTYTATTNDDVILVESTSAWTLTLYTAVGNSGKKLVIKKITADYNTVTIDGNASETIDSQATIKLIAPFDEITLISDGTNWIIASQDLEPITVRAYRNASGQTISNNTETRVDFNGEQFDDFAAWDASTNFRFNPPRDGKYFVQMSVAFPSPNDGTRLTALIRKNGSIHNRVNTVSAGPTDTGIVCFAVVDLTTSDYIDGAVVQNSGGNEDITDGINDTFIEIVEIRK